MAKFPCCEDALDHVEVFLASGGQLVGIQVKAYGRVSGSIFLRPEDVLRFAQEALHLADEAAEHEPD